MRRYQQGLTLIELMIAMALGTGVVLAAVALMQAARSTYLSVADSAQVQENGRYALDLIARSVRQANYVPQDNPTFQRDGLGVLEPGIFGIDNARVGEHSSGLSSPSANLDAHGSDLLAIRFFGSGPANRPDNDMLNCAGFAVPDRTARPRFQILKSRAARAFSTSPLTAPTNRNCVANTWPATVAGAPLPSCAASSPSRCCTV